MSTTQIICKSEMWQPEPQTNMVERIPLEERRKLSINKETLESIQDCTWEDLRGLSFVFEEY
ncbi:MAG: hypothetical protein OEM77_03625 [Nitrosopumilus sp.]|nr:hypothetical protein [Nitrosopumilus sp.]MDH3822769.1 hypothetical protein [Nitrosopumilus sp.]MDH3833700.1 hypothetical protein [Nitrosopumilus sp.]